MAQIKTYPKNYKTSSNVHSIKSTKNGSVDAYMLHEMISVFGKGTKIVNVITGESFIL